MLVSFSVLLLSGCTSSTTTDKTPEKKDKKETVSKNQTFSVNVVQEMPTADSALSSDGISSVALNNVYEGIYRLNKNQELEPAGAKEKAEISEDGLVYHIKLREESKWSDGKPVTAHDYVYAWQRVVDPENKSEYAYLHEPIKNAKAITAGEKDKIELGVTAVSDYELKIELEEPTPYFESLLAFTTYLPQREDIVTKYGKNYASTSEKAVYNGPFVLSEFDGPGTDTQWSYVKNKHYWDKNTVKLEKIDVNVVKSPATSLSLYEDGQVEDIQISGELAQQMANHPDYFTDKEAGVLYIELNQIQKDSPFKNKNMRKALSYAMDRETLVNQILTNGSSVATGLVPSGVAKSPTDKKDFTESTKTKVSFDSKKAKSYWEKAKKELGKEKIEVDLLLTDDDNTKKVGEFIKGQLEEQLEGLSVSITPVPFQVRLDRSSKGDFSMVYSGWVADYTDPSSFVNLFVTGNSYNLGKYSNKKYDEKIQLASKTDVTDPQKRWQDMVDAEDIIMEDAGLIPMIEIGRAHLRTEKIKNVVVHPTGSRYDYKWAYKID